MATQRRLRFGFGSGRELTWCFDGSLRGAGLRCTPNRSRPCRLGTANARTQQRVRRRQLLARVSVADTAKIRGPQTDLVIGEAATAAAAPTRGGETYPVPKPPDANASIEICRPRKLLSARTLRFSKAFGAWSVRRRQRGRRTRSGPHSARGPTRGSPPARNQPRTLSLCRDALIVSASDSQCVSYHGALRRCGSAEHAAVPTIHRRGRRSRGRSDRS